MNEHDWLRLWDLCTRAMSEVGYTNTSTDVLVDLKRVRTYAERQRRRLLRREAVLDQHASEVTRGAA